MRPVAKAGLVASGYIAAFAIAVLFVGFYVGATNGPDRQTYGGMYAFGDSLLFPAVFGVAAVPATGVALFFLRPCPAFWLTLSFGSAVLAATGFAACLEYIAASLAGPASLLHAWSGLAVLRVLIAPLLLRPCSDSFSSFPA